MHDATIKTITNIIAMQMVVPTTMLQKFNLFAALVAVRAATY